VLKYTLNRGVTLSAAVVAGIFLAVVVTNFGGFVDNIYLDRIKGILFANSVMMMDEGVELEERVARLDDLRWDLEEAYGLHTPFFDRCLRWTADALTFGFSEVFAGYKTPNNFVLEETMVIETILESLPPSLLLFAAAMVPAFFLSVWMALVLSRNPGNWLDRLLVTLTPISSAPSWVYGVILTVIFAIQLGVLPERGIYTETSYMTTLDKVLTVAVHLVLPATAIFLTSFFQSVYSWRMFFLLHAGEDYLDLAIAKGLPTRMLERKYVLRPTMPTIVTSFSLLVLGFWQELIALEVWFEWPGIGTLFIQAIRGVNSAITMTIVVIFAYLFVLTVFLLDIVYALIDPRVRLGGGENRGRLFRRKLKQGLAGVLRNLRQEKPTPGRAARLEQGKRKVSIRAWVRDGWNWIREAWKQLLRAGHQLWMDLRQYPSASVGLTVIVIMLGVGLYSLIKVPQQQVIEMWRSGSTESYRTPKLVPPEWTNWFRKEKLPVNRSVSTMAGDGTKTITPTGGKGKDIVIELPVEYTYVTFPQDVYLIIHPSYEEKFPFAKVYWVTPDGREVQLISEVIKPSYQTRLSWYIRESRQPEVVKAKNRNRPMEFLFADPKREQPAALKGTYILKIEGYTFEEMSDLDAEVIVLGQVYGFAGTDNANRDLSLALGWGILIALVFGLIGAVVTSVVTMLIAAVGTWYGGWVDQLVQRITEVNMMLPVLPIAITMYFIYAKTIWAILGVVVLLSIFGKEIKNYRTVFLQVKTEVYIEAALSYGASNSRIIFRYLVPRIVSLLLPRLVVLVPGYVFLEATLAFLGAPDEYLPTLGKVIYEGFSWGALYRYPHWVLLPLAALVLIGVSFAMVGLALDRALNPKLREM